MGSCFASGLTRASTWNVRAHPFFIVKQINLLLADNMKRILIQIPVLVWIALVFLALSCSKAPLFESSVTSVSATLFSAEIKLNSNVENWDGDYKLGIELWTEDSNRNKYYSSSRSSGVIQLSKLFPSTAYNYRVFIEADNIYYGESGTFKTQSLDKVSFGTTTVESCTLDNAVIRSLLTIPASYSETEVAAGILYSENAEQLEYTGGFGTSGTPDNLFEFYISGCKSITFPHFQGSVIEASISNRSDIVDHNGEGITYFYRPFVVLPAFFEGFCTEESGFLQMGEIQSVSLPGLPEVNGYRYVDLGLESGTLWSICDIGATTPLEPGNEFQWGGTSPKTQGSTVTAPFLTSSQAGVYWEHHISKYNFQSKYGNVDNKGTLEENNDTATKNYGAPWRMPTKKEFDEIVSSCSFQLWGNRYKVIGPNGHYIYLYLNSDVQYDSGGYWSSSLYTSDSVDAIRLSLRSNSVAVKTQFRGYTGYIRPVISREQIQ